MIMVKNLLVVVMLSFGTVVSAQNQEGQLGTQGNSLSKLMVMLDKMTDEQKAYARANWLVAPEAYVNQHDHPSSYVISPNPAPDTQSTCECSGCSSAYLLRFYGESENGFSEIAAKWGEGQHVAVLAYEREGDATPYVSGNFIITSIEETSPAQDDATYSIQLESDGEPTTYPGKEQAGE